ncbi:hypothetical protein [Paenibacillus sp. Z6-24]
MQHVVTYDQIEIMPYKLVRLHDFKVTKTVNDHARMTFTGIIDEKKRELYVQASDEDTQIKAFIKDEAGNRHPIFRGIAMEVEEHVVNGVHYLTVEAISHTYELDIKRHKRSFQNPGLSYNALIQKIIAPYGKAEAQDMVTDGQAIGTFVMQYDETDWEFLKRLASHFYSPLIPAVGYGVPKFYFGLPMGLDKGEIDSINYKVNKRVADYQRAAENHIPGVQDQDFIQYEVESVKVLEPGYEVKFRGQKLLVSEAVTEMKGSILTHTYKLSPRSGIRPIKNYNRTIIGASIYGKVVGIYRDKVQIKFKMDEQLDTSTDFWFPYSTIYASADNTGWYCMPEENDDIRIYFPSYREEECYAMSSVKRDAPAPAAASAAHAAPAPTASGSHSSGGRGASSPTASAAPAASAAASQKTIESQMDPRLAQDRMSDPAVKTMRTKSGKEIMLAPHEIVISSGSNLYIKISDSEGIIINSPSNVNITAGTEMTLSSKDMKLNAGTIELMGNGNSIRLDDKTTFMATEVKMN